RVCRLAAQQMRVVFSFVELEIKERALKAFMRVILRLSALSFEGANLEETVGRIAPLGLELPGVRQVRLIGRETEPELYDSALQEIDQRELAEGEEETTVVGSVLAAGAGLRCGLSGAGEYLSALERGPRPRWLLLFVPNEFSGFDTQSLELLHLFASYAAITVSNHNLALRQKRVNDDLRAAQDRLVEAESLAALGDMASGLAHDFNNMLGAIIGKLQILQLQSSDNDLRRKLRDLEELAGDGAERIRRLQEFAISAAPASLKPLDLCDLFRRYQDLERPWGDAAREKSVTVRFDPPTLPEAIIAGKEKDIYLLLDSVIANAVDVTGADGVVVVTLTLEAGRAALRVRDSGPGIPDSIKNKIFNPFFTTKRDRGAGLGLSVAHSIAVRHGGSISAQSISGAIGATFSTSFPLVNSKPVDAPVESPERAPRPLRIMVVDDDAQIRDVLSDMLTLLDQDSELYEDGPSALAAFTPGKYDLVITDLGMPGMSGMELTSELRDLEPELPIAMVTGWGAQLDPAEMTERGIFRVISKPFYLKDIRDLVTHLPEAAV
ncbi:MAG TPA: response regulator, partial [candidate division Zixibacteria bacterium]|nr:response regulator [candidate division Zixibacteria bacterium]